ncbi:hypothetical protein, partial [Klebsiella pneumoniae]|uniref:hypothetical protein n=1 Tax=Klebsiella pneumoniae TaxID=573 RepID=UPI003A981495
PTTYLVDTTLSDASDYDQTVHAVRLLIYSISAGRFSQLCRLKQNVKKAELAPGFGHHTYRLNNRREHMEQLLNGLHEVNYCLDQVCRELHKLKNIYHVHFPLNELRVSGGEPIAAL